MPCSHLAGKESHIQLRLTADWQARKAATISHGNAQKLAEGDKMSNHCDLQPLLRGLRDQTRSDTIPFQFGKLSCIVSTLNVIINSIISARETPTDYGTLGSVGSL